MHIIKLRWIDAQCGDQVISQYRLFLENDVKQYHERFTNFQREDGLLDEFFFSTCEVDKNYKELSSVIEIILTLSHGQAAVERNFSLGKSFVVDNISETSIINKKLIKDHMFANKLTAATIHITREMHSYYKSARIKYEKHKEEEKKKKEKTEKDNQKGLIGQEIDSLKLLIAEKERTAQFLEAESFTAMNDAENKNDMAFVKKANSLKRSRDETKEEINTLEKTLSILEEKRAKL